MASKVSLKSKDKGWDAFWKRAEDLVKLRSARVRVGVLGDTAKGREQRGKITLAELAAVLHYGTKDGHIPPRPFFTMTFDAKRAELKELGAKLMGEVLFGHITLEQALNAMGAKLAADVKKTIADGVPPPNAPSTMLRKAQTGRTRSRFVNEGQEEQKAGWFAKKFLGKEDVAAKRATRKKAKNLGAAFGQIGALASVKPLIDTGRLLGAITWSVDLNGDKK